MRRERITVIVVVMSMVVHVDGGIRVKETRDAIEIGTIKGQDKWRCVEA
jgi:hypothetical protein